jgi:hypothetical protein
MRREEAEQAALRILPTGFLVGFLRTTSGGIILKVCSPMKGNLLGESGVARLASTDDVQRWLVDHPPPREKVPTAIGPAVRRKKGA